MTEIEDELTAEFRGTDRYQVLERIGSGGMGVVYAAFDRLTRSKVALKLLHQLNPESLARFKREFRSIQDIHHPNLISLGELREDGGVWFFTMELLTGEDFRAFVRGGLRPAREAKPIAAEPTVMASQRAWPSTLIGRSIRTVNKDDLPPKQRRRFHEGRLRQALIQVVRGLSVLHQAHKVHRDIKPSNIVVEPDGRVVILDFGIAVDMAEGERLSGERLIGTGVYMAPEQIDPAACSPASDHYAVGVLMYEALTGRRPFEGRNALDVLRRKRAEPPPRPRELATGVPEDLDALCMDLLAIDPAARPDAEEILRRLGDDGPLPRPERLRPSPQSAYVGRERELATLIEAVQPPLCGHTIFVIGDSGMGKSTLLSRFEQLAGDALFLHGRCYERESVPFKGIDDVIDALARHLSLLPESDRQALMPKSAALMAQVFPELERVVAHSEEEGAEPWNELEAQDAWAERWGQPEAQEVRAERWGQTEAQDTLDSHDLRQQAFTALRELFANLGRSRPLVVVIDDMQWADVDTWILLGHLMRPPEPPPLVLLLVMQLHHEVARSELHTLVDGEVRVLELKPLTPSEVRDLAALLLRAGGCDDELLAEAIASESEGHPLFVHELVRHALESDLEPASGASGRALSQASDAARVARLEDALQSRFTRLSPPARRLLELVATAGVPTENSVMAAAAELEFDLYRRLLTELRLARLVRTSGIEPRDTVEHEHDRIRTAVLAGLGEHDSRRLHASLARALEDTGVSERSPELAVQHLSAAGKHERAAFYALQAAERAMESLAFERAASLYRAVLESGQHTGESRQRVLLRLARALAGCGQGYQAAQVHLEAARGADEATRLACLRRAAEHLLNAGHVAQGLDVLHQALHEIGASIPATPAQALASLRGYRALIRARGIRWRERPTTAIVPRNLFAIDVYRSAGRALSMIDHVRGADFQARALYHALRAGEPVRLAKSLAFEAGYVGAQDRASQDRAHALLAEAEAIARRNDDAHVQAWIESVRGILALHVGHYRRASAILSEAEQRFAILRSASWERNRTRMFLLAALQATGELSQLRAHFDQYVHAAEQRGDRYTCAMLRRSCSMVWLVAGDMDAARRELGRTEWQPSAGGGMLYDWYEARARAELALYEGSAAAALDRFAGDIERMQRALLMRVLSVRIDAWALRGRMLIAASCDAHGRARHHDLADWAPWVEARWLIHRLEAEDVLSGRLHAAVLRAGLAGAHGYQDRCLEHLRQVEELAERAGMRLVAESARHGQGTLRGGAAGAALVAGAQAWMRGQGVADPARLAAYVVPGIVRR